MNEPAPSIPLFRSFPLLADGLPYVSLGLLPTPVEKLERLGAELGLDRLYVKRDDVSGRVYGGNKIRKLEFTLARALGANAKEVLTFGFAGSNHALATAVSAKQLGLTSISMLMPQANAHYVRRNLLMSYYCGAELHQHRGKAFVAAGTLYQLLRHCATRGRFPQIIPPGGSSALGTTGFVNAAFELKEQVTEGLMPEPDRIYVALGTMGTAVGLKIGLMAAGLKSRLVPVRVVEEGIVNTRTFVRHFKRTVSYLRSLDPSFPALALPDDEAGIVGGYLGDGYAHYTEEGMEAIRLMADAEGIKLDGTYTGKTLAALMADAGSGELRDEVVLFWNTLNSLDLSEAISTVDYRRLPRCFHRYFEEDVQPLDRSPEEGDNLPPAGG